MPKEVDAITKLYDFLLWIIPKLEKFPRSQKFLIADRIEIILLDVLDLWKKLGTKKTGDRSIMFKPIASYSDKLLSTVMVHHDPIFILKIRML